jgi:hypothetical protein
MLAPMEDPRSAATTGQSVDRRELLRWALLTTALGSVRRASSESAPHSATAPASHHDFDFFLGHWQVAHRRLKQRLAGSNDWEEFEGTSHCQSLLGGIVNLNESLVHRSSGSYYGMGLRAFDAESGSWADWYLDGRKPTKIDVPGMGRFDEGVGTFLSNETFEGKPVVVRGRWSQVTPRSFVWEQAFSPDGGKTWETNWVMRHTRV